MKTGNKKQFGGSLSKKVSLRGVAMGIDSILLKNGKIVDKTDWG